MHHLLMRGEDAAAIRILDKSPSTRKEAIDANIDFVLTDVSDKDAVGRAFAKAWPEHVQTRPLTVFHTVAYIKANERTSDFLPPYVKVNILGTKNVLSTARAAGASCFIATSSASVAMKPPAYFPPPWQLLPTGVIQTCPNAEPKTLDAPLDLYGCCYAWSKAQAEKAVHEANDPTAGFLTGAIRPGHAIYGHGVENPSSLTWDYLRRGGSPSWMHNVVAHFVCAQNVSIGHLAYEDALLQRGHSGGRGYCVTDPNPPITYASLYDTLDEVAHPATPVKFTPFNPIIMLLLAYVVEAYVLLQHRYLGFLPKLTGDLVFLQPAVFNMSTLHLLYTDDAARRDIGYRAPINTLEGFSLAVADWNAKVEAKQQGQTASSVTGAEILAT